jgi:hypothetical protein
MSDETEEFNREDVISLRMDLDEETALLFAHEK